MAPVLPCPFTAGGCPLFNITGDPSTSANACQGGCVPPDANLAHRPVARPSLWRDESSSTSSRRSYVPYDLTAAIAYDANSVHGSAVSTAQTSPITPNSLSGLPSGITDALLFGDLCLPPAETPAGLGESWPPLDAVEYGVSPTQLEMPAYWPAATGPPNPSSSAMGKRPFATGPLSADAGQVYAATSNQPQPSSYSGRHDLWDIEELVRFDQPNAKRVRMSPPPAAATRMSTIPRASGGSPTELRLPVLPDPPRLPSPPMSPEEGEHVTPFISKLCYLLEHPEYEPWIRWDSSGQYLLVAHTKSHLLEILEKFFRHTVISSFIRQLNIYGFRRATTSSLLSVLENTKYSTTVDIPGRDEPETFSAADYSAFFNPAFFRSVPDGPQCRLAALKPLAKDRPPRKRTGSSGSAKAVPTTRSNPSRRSSSSSTASAGQRRRRSDSSDSDFEA
ncbi:hypothetical protein BMF94_2277 [Rhodotorula taiwanensis]|uniref:HSF-type DNA-binding domain-containing protein n=1 Tax=Rhodotorula taiwanensis TaxID=741276 RepID=A0A2S5BCM5_9BASI|nr:hypothetical protein BMF94_2277 [Rhodotorula taiwanensis]